MVERVPGDNFYIALYVLVVRGLRKRREHLKKVLLYPLGDGVEQNMQRSLEKGVDPLSKEFTSSRQSQRPRWSVIRKERI